MLRSVSWNGAGVDDDSNKLFVSASHINYHFPNALVHVTTSSFNCVIAISASSYTPQESKRFPEKYSPFQEEIPIASDSTEVTAGFERSKVCET